MATKRNQMLVLVIAGEAADYLGAETTWILREWNHPPRLARRLAGIEQERRAVKQIGCYVGVLQARSDNKPRRRQKYARASMDLDAFDTRRKKTDALPPVAVRKSW